MLVYIDENNKQAKKSNFALYCAKTMFCAVFLKIHANCADSLTSFFTVLNSSLN